MSRRIPRGLDYLKNEPYTIWWDIIAGPPGCKLNALQDHDLIFDDYDLQIRKLIQKISARYFFVEKMSRYF